MVNLQIAAAGITFQEIINFLEQEQILPEVIVKILASKIVKQFAEQKNLSITLEEIQEECHKFRAQHHLETSSDLIAWLVDRGVLYEEWEQRIGDRLLAKKLAKILFASQIEAYFMEHKREFQEILLYQIIVPFERIATDLFYQIEEQELSFFEAAHLYDIDQRRRLTCGYSGWVSLAELDPELVEAILNGNVGEIIPPVKTAAGYHLMVVEEVTQLDLTPEIQEKILDKLFENWLNLEVQYRLQKCQTQDMTHQSITTYLSRKSLENPR
jgi:parvulin-like peptidyl-prolyl isomerase